MSVAYAIRKLIRAEVRLMLAEMNEKGMVGTHLRVDAEVAYENLAKQLKDEE